MKDHCWLCLIGLTLLAIYVPAYGDEIVQDPNGGQQQQTIIAAPVVLDHQDNNTTSVDLHKQITDSLAEDEERVLAGGEVKVRKKRTFCKKCYPTYSYGYGGGGGCCGSCGQCGGGYGGGYVQPIRVKVKVIPVYGGYGGGYGGGCGSCYRPCNVCGRK